MLIGDDGEAFPLMVIDKLAYQAVLVEGVSLKENVRVASNVEIERTSTLLFM